MRPSELDKQLLWASQPPSAVLKNKEEAGYVKPKLCIWHVSAAAWVAMLQPGIWPKGYSGSWGPCLCQSTLQTHLQAWALLIAEETWGLRRLNLATGGHFLQASTLLLPWFSFPWPAPCGWASSHQSLAKWQRHFGDRVCARSGRDSHLWCGGEPQRSPHHPSAISNCHQYPAHSAPPQSRTASEAYARFRCPRHNVFFPPFPLQLY